MLHAAKDIYPSALRCFVIDLREKVLDEPLCCLYSIGEGFGEKMVTTDEDSAVGALVSRSIIPAERRLSLRDSY